MEVTFTDEKVLVKGDFNTIVPVAAVNIYLDSAPYGQVNNDYDAESWTVKPNKKRYFVLEIPRSELHQQNVDGFQVRARFVFGNGFSQNHMADFSWKDLKPYHFVKQ